MPNKIHIANATSKDLYVTPSLDLAWLTADVEATIATDLIVALTPVPFDDIAKAASHAVTGVTGGGIYRQLFDFATRRAVRVPPGRFEVVLETMTANPWNYLTPSAWGHIFDLDTIDLCFIQEGRLPARVDTGSDFSWIVTDEGIVRARYGKIWQENPDDGAYPWPAATVNPNEDCVNMVLSHPGGKTELLHEKDYIFKGIVAYALGTVDSAELEISVYQWHADGKTGRTAASSTRVAAGVSDREMSVKSRIRPTATRVKVAVMLREGPTKLYGKPHWSEEWVARAKTDTEKMVEKYREFKGPRAF